jgi:hypothetical protein
MLVTHSITRHACFGVISLVLILIVLTVTAAMKSLVVFGDDGSLKAYLDGDTPLFLAGYWFIVDPTRDGTYLPGEKSRVYKETSVNFSAMYRGPPLV